MNKTGGSYKVTGGKPLSGVVPISGAKNVALKVLIAGLLFDSPVILENIPRIGDVYEVLSIISHLGASAEFTGPNQVTVNGAGLSTAKVDLLTASKVRVSFMFFAPLLQRLKKADIPNPGGCRLGARPIDRIIEGMEALGVAVTYDSESGYFHARLPKDPQGTYRFSKPSHTGTELLLMLTVLSRERCIIENSALEPEIDDLIAFLNAGGARIRRTEKTITVDGVDRLVQQHPYRIVADRNEAATYAALAIATRGDITITGVRSEELMAFNEKLVQAGAGVEEVSPDSIRYFFQKPLTAVSVDTEPHPGFMTDWQPPFAVLMTQANGVSVIHERMFENRFSYVSELEKLGADISYITIPVESPHEFYEFTYDPEHEYRQAIEIHGPTDLHNGVLEIADLRAGATLAIAALTAQGESIIHGAIHLERGYESFVEKVTSLGGVIAKA
jgi:UDP-N-acetylglucosamine 1-carboxyvinyltransferase